MDDDDNILDFEKFPTIQEDVKDLSLTSLYMSTETFGQTEFTMHLEERTIMPHEKFLLESIQMLQEVVICFQNKFKEFESVLEYSNPENIVVYTYQQWLSMNWNDVEIQIPSLINSLRKTLQIIYDMSRDMDNAVVRLRHENEKCNDAMKISEIKNKKNNHIASDYSKYQTFDGIQPEEFNVSGFNKKSRKQETQINEFKLRIREFESDALVAEGAIEKLETKIRKQKKKIRSLKDDNDSTLLDAIVEIQEEIKKIHKECKTIGDENIEKPGIKRQISRDIDAKIDHLIKSTSSEAEQNQEYHEKTYSGITDIKKELKNLKKQSLQSRNNEDSQTTKDLENLISELNKELKFKDQEFQRLTEELEDHKREIVNLEKTVEERDVEVQELKSNLPPNEVGDNKMEVDSGTVNMNRFCSVDNVTDSKDTLDEKDRLLKQKNDALEKIRMKMLEAKTNEKYLQEENDKLTAETTQLKADISEFKSEIEKKARALSIMRDKIRDLNALQTSADAVEEYKRKFEQSKNDTLKLQEDLTLCMSNLKKSGEECENLKKDKNRLEIEIQNIKRLNFEKKPANKQ